MSIHRRMANSHCECTVATLNVIQHCHIPLPCVHVLHHMHPYMSYYCSICCACHQHYIILHRTISTMLRGDGKCVMCDHVNVQHKHCRHVLYLHTQLFVICVAIGYHKRTSVSMSTLVFTAYCGCMQQS